MVPEAVKLTVVNLLKDDAIGDEPAPRSYRSAAELLAYSMIGAEGFAGANETALAFQVEQRIERAMAQGDTMDAQLVMVVMVAKVIQPSVVEHFALTRETD